MQSWMALTIFGGIIVLIGIFVFVAIKRGHSYRDKARELGLDFVEEDKNLSQRLSGTLPLFSKGTPSCWYVVSGHNRTGAFHIFQFSYTRKKAYGNRTDRENEGLVLCQYSDRLDFNKVIDRDKSSPFMETWQIEYDGPWYAMKRQDDDGKKGISGERLQAFYNEAFTVIDSIIK